MCLLGSGNGEEAGGAFSRKNTTEREPRRALTRTVVPPGTEGPQRVLSREAASFNLNLNRTTLRAVFRKDHGKGRCPVTQEQLGCCRAQAGRG